MLDRFFIWHSQIPISAAATTLSWPLVGLSYVVASIAAYAVLAVFLRISPANERSRRRGSLLAAVMASAGIWSMHFTGMTALKMDMVHTYDVGVTLLSLIVLFACCWTFFRGITREKLPLRVILLSSLLMATGIGLMHYIGMAAIRMDGRLKYLPDLLLLSFLIAAATSAVSALFTRVTAPKKWRGILQIGAALFMGAAICAVHYTGLTAAIIIPFAGCRIDPAQNDTILVLFAGAGWFLVLTCTLMLLAQRFVEGGGANRRIKWHYIYYVLAALDLSTAGVAAYLNHQVFSAYDGSTDIRHTWSAYRNEIIELGFSAYALNRSRIDVLRNHHVPGEPEKFNTELSSYVDRIQRLRVSIASSLNSTASEVRAFAREFDRSFDNIAAFAPRIRKAALDLFTAESQGEEQKAYKAMEDMDGLFALQSRRILELDFYTNEVVAHFLDARLQNIHRLKAYESYVLIFLAMMVAGATYYGYWIAKRVKEDERWRLQAATVRQHIAELQSEYNSLGNIAGKKTIHEYHKVLLHAALQRLLLITDSEFGFAGEVIEENGSSYVKLFSTEFSNARVKDGLRQFPDKFFHQGVEVHTLQSVLGEVLKTKQPLIVNGPHKHPAYAARYPKGHPPIKACIGVPAMSGERLIGVAGLANAPGGYSEDCLQTIQPMIDLFVSLIETMRSEEARIALEEKYAALIHNVPAIVFRSDASGKMVSISGQLETVTGFSPADFIGDKAGSMASIIHIEDRQTAQAARASLTDRGKYDAEYRIVCADGSVKWLHEHGTVVSNEDANSKTIEGYLIDITERKRLEAGGLSR